MRISTAILVVLILFCQFDAFGASKSVSKIKSTDWFVGESGDRFRVIEISSKIYGYQLVENGKFASDNYYINCNNGSFIRPDGEVGQGQEISDVCKGGINKVISWGRNAYSSYKQMGYCAIVMANIGDLRSGLVDYYSNYSKYPLLPDKMFPDQHYDIYPGNSNQFKTEKGVTFTSVLSSENNFIIEAEHDLCTIKYSITGSEGEVKYATIPGKTPNFTFTRQPSTPEEDAALFSAAKSAGIKYKR